MNAVRSRLTPLVTGIGTKMKMKSLAVFTVLIASVIASPLAFAKKTYSCSPVVNGKETGPTISIEVWDSEGASDAVVKAASVFNNRGVKFDRINCS